MYSFIIAAYYTKVQGNLFYHYTVLITQHYKIAYFIIILCITAYYTTLHDSLMYHYTVHNCLLHNITG